MCSWNFSRNPNNPSHPLMKTFSAFWTGPLDAAIREAAAAPYTMSLVGEDPEAVGQHGGADLFALTHSLRLATRAEYRGLAAELRRIGYRLKISCRATRAD